MPVMGGYKATEEILKLPQYNSVPIIAMTADAMGGVREKCLEVGMMDFITKPINPNQLLETLQKWLTPAKRIDSRKDAQPAGKAQNKILIPKLAGVDVEDGLSHVNGNSGLYYDLLIKFMDNHQNFMTELKKSLSEADSDVGRRMIHTLKGMSANLGMIKVYEATVNLEEQLRIQTTSDLVEILMPLAVEMESVLESLKNNLVRKPESSQDIPFSNAEPLLHELARLLKDQDPEAAGVLRKIGKVKGYEKQMEQLEIAVKRYDFDKAIDILESMGIERQQV
jgi:HPt (histidine-containing phosphotransfer) domain-containing protein